MFRSYEICYQFSLPGLEVTWFKRWTRGHWAPRYERQGRKRWLSLHRVLIGLG